jgi:hypothetical protein
MRQHPGDLTLVELDELTDLARAVAEEEGAFDATDLLLRYLATREMHGRYVSAASVTPVLDQLVRLGELQRLDTIPRRWAVRD